LFGSFIKIRPSKKEFQWPTMLKRVIVANAGSDVGR
jgi:hypothetical protein